MYIVTIIYIFLIFIVLTAKNDDPFGSPGRRQRLRRQLFGLFVLTQFAIFFPKMAEKSQRCSSTAMFLELRDCAAQQTDHPAGMVHRPFAILKVQGNRHVTGTRRNAQNQLAVEFTFRWRCRLERNGFHWKIATVDLAEFHVVSGFRVIYPGILR